MYAVLIIVGLIVLVGLSVAAGMMLARELLHRRHMRLENRKWALWSWEQELLTSAELRDCPACRLLRRRAELQHPPADSEAA